MRLLVAEDEPELARAIGAILKHGGYLADTVFDGMDALAYLESGLYDGAILDIMMPKLDGLSVLRRIRSTGNSVPVLILSARSEVDDRVAGLDGGADDYLTKPFAAKELLARVRAMTRRQGDLVSPELTLGDLVLDLASFEFCYRGARLRLTGREFQMAQMLMAKPGAVISTEHFMEKIWGFDSEAELNVVWVTISALRKKLAAIGSPAQIRVSRGLGYYIEENHD